MSSSLLRTTTLASALTPPSTSQRVSWTTTLSPSTYPATSDTPLSTTSLASALTSSYTSQSVSRSSTLFPATYPSTSDTPLPTCTLASTDRKKNRKIQNEPQTLKTASIGFLTKEHHFFLIFGVALGIVIFFLFFLNVTSYHSLREIRR